MSSPATQLSQQLRAAAPALGPLGAPVALIAVALGVAGLMLAALERTRSGDSLQRAGAWRDVDTHTAAVLATDQAAAAAAELEQDLVQVRLGVHADLRAQAASTLVQVSVPFFDTPLQANNWLEGWRELMLQGIVSGAAFAQAQAQVAGELERLELGITPLGALDNPGLFNQLRLLPTFSSTAGANNFQAFAFGLFQLGHINNAGFARVQAHVLAELARLAVGAPPTPAPPPPAPVLVPVPVPGVPPELAAAIAQLQMAIATLEQAGGVTAEQVHQLQRQVDEIVREASKTPPTPPDMGKIVVIMAALAAALTSTFAAVQTLGIGALTPVKAGVLAHAAQNARYGCQSGFLAPLLGVARQLLPQAIAGGVLILDNPIKDALKEQVSALLSSQLDPSRFPRPTDYEGAVGNASQRLLEAIGFGLTAQGIAYTAEAMTPLKQMGFNQLAGFLGQVAGFDRIAAGLMGTVENAAIYAPLRFEANKRFRPTLPNETQLALMFQKRSLTRAELNEFYEKAGLPELYVDRIPGFIYNDPSPSLLIRAFQLAPPAAVEFGPDDLKIMEIAGIDPLEPNAYFKLKLAKAGLDPLDVQAFVPVLQMGLLRREQTLLYEQVSRLFREGYIDEARARQEIEAGQRPSTIVEFRLRALALGNEYEEKEDLRQLIGQAVAKGLITTGEAGEQLGALGMSQSRVRIHTLRAQMGLAPRSVGAAPGPIEAPPVAVDVEL